MLGKAHSLLCLVGQEPIGLQAALAGNSLWLACGGCCVLSPVLTLVLLLMVGGVDEEIPCLEANFSFFR